MNDKIVENTDSSGIKFEIIPPSEEPQLADIFPESKQNMERIDVNDSLMANYKSWGYSSFAYFLFA